MGKVGAVSWSGVGVVLAILSAPFLLSSCAIEYSCTPWGARDLDSAVVAVEEGLSVKADHVSSYDCEEYGGQVGILMAPFSKVSIQSLGAMGCEPGDAEDVYFCRTGDIDFLVRDVTSPDFNAFAGPAGEVGQFQIELR